jgi:hypothetical protein
MMKLIMGFRNFVNMPKTEIIWDETWQMQFISNAPPPPPISNLLYDVL